MEQGRKLQRDFNNRVIAGVCSGLADYLGIDTALMRVLFIVALICGSFGFWLYIILWAVLPSKQISNNGNVNEPYVDENPVQEESVDEENRNNKGLMLFSILLIVAGIVLLLNNFIYMSWLWKLWPAALIIIGVLLILNSKNKRDEQ